MPGPAPKQRNLTSTLPSANEGKATSWETRKRTPEPYERCPVELRLSAAMKDRLLAIAEAGLLGRTIEDVITHFTREALHRDWLSQELQRACTPAPAAQPAAAPPALTTASTTTSARPENRLLRMPEVCRRIGVSRSSLYKMIKEKSFPASRQLGPMTVAWLESDVNDWIAGTSAKRYS